MCESNLGLKSHAIKWYKRDDIDGKCKLFG